MKTKRDWRQCACQLKTETYALYLAYRDPRVPWYARLWAIVVVVYAFSPVDLIPDFIPVLGYLDDLVLVPLGVLLAIKLVPAAVMGIITVAHPGDCNDTPHQADTVGDTEVGLLQDAGKNRVFLGRHHEFGVGGADLVQAGLAHEVAYQVQGFGRGDGVDGNTEDGQGLEVGDGRLAIRHHLR